MRKKKKYVDKHARPKSYSGQYYVKNREKYKGDASNVWYRSSWELKMMKYCDSKSHIIEWSSEEVIIPYLSPIDGKMHRYFPDFLVTLINNNGKKEKILIEVKPKKYTQPPNKQKRQTRKYITEVKTWGINEAKWKAAEHFCKKKGWQFKIFTERDLGV